MKQVFLREMKANRKSLLIWAVGVFALVAAGFYKYSGIAASSEVASLVIDMMPRLLKVMFGVGALPIDTPEGFYACMHLWICVIAYFHAAMLGATILAKEERDRTAEFLYTKPIRRESVILGKMLAGILNMAVIALVAFVTAMAIFIPQVPGTGLGASVGRAILGMFLTQLVFFYAGLLGAAALPSHKAAGQFAANLVLITYLLSVIIEMVGTVDFLDFLTPFRYFHAAGVMQNGFSGFYLCLSVALALACGMLAIHCFRQRNLHH